MEQGYRTFRDIYTTATEFLQDQASTNTTVVKNIVNRKLIDIANSFDFDELRRVSSVTFNTSSAFLYMPPDVQTILAIMDSSADEFLERHRLENLAYFDPSKFDGTGEVLKFAEAGSVGRTADFSSSAETINVASTSSTDVSLAVRLVGIDANGHQFSESVTTNASDGTTAVTSTNTFSDFLSVSIDVSHAGKITATGTTSSTVYARVSIDDKTVRYKRVRLLSPPNTANTAFVIYKKFVSELKNDDDIPEIPVSEYLIEASIAAGKEYDGKIQEAEQHNARARSIIAGITAQNVDESRVQSRPVGVPRLGVTQRVFRAFPS